MKTPILTLVCFLTLLQMTKAQTQFPFPTTYSVWDYQMVFGVIGPDDRFEAYRDVLTGDTAVFNGKTYYKVFTRKLCYCICSSSDQLQPIANSTTNLLGGVREDSGRVYFTRFGGTGIGYFNPVNDTLLYDFNLQVGDTINYADGKLILENISIEPDGRKKFRFKGGPPMYWREGIGSFGILRTKEQFNHFSSCFSPGGPCNNPCGIVDTDQPEKLPFKISPSLAGDFTHLQVDAAYGAYHFEIYSQDGRLLECQYNLVGDQRIDLQSFPHGLLLVALKDKNGNSFTLKLMHGEY